MKERLCCVAVLALAWAGAARADVNLLGNVTVPAGGLVFTDAPADANASPAQTAGMPILADAADDDTSIYAPPPPPREGQGINNGGATLNLDVSYANRYVYRGVDHDAVAAKGDSLNLLIDGMVTFDFGRYPHPFFGVFTDVYDSDPVSRFQEIRPFVGADWTLRPFILEVRDTNYIYPERESFNTSEIAGQVTFDDSLLLHTDKPWLSPYFMGAYDYTRNHGWYLEAGIQHEFDFEDLGLTLTPSADIAYILGIQQEFVYVNSLHDTGWQHAEVGLNASYSLNMLFNVSKRFGEWDLKAFIYYDAKLNRLITANNVLWGGVGIGFTY